MRFSNKIVVITGAASGIGAETARRFGAEGATVIIADINTVGAEKVSASIPNSVALFVDVIYRDSVHQLVDAVTKRFGHIDILINNAHSCTDASFLNLTPEHIQQDFAVSIMGPMFACQEVIPGMIANGGGIIVNMSSVNGLSYFGNEAYSAAKAGMVNLTKAIAVQFGPYGIRCNAVAPGTIETEAWDARKRVDPNVIVKAAAVYPLGRVGQPSDVADATLFLASQEAAWITGIVLPVEGGLLAGNLALAQTIVVGGEQPTQ